MIIDLRTHVQLGEGFFATVFSINGRAYKLFKHGPVYPLEYVELNERPFRIFEAQCDAYRRAAEHDILRKHTPEFYDLAPLTPLQMRL